jgi:LmbE family N-acetylglucosaminyl deacetylase
MTKRGALGYVHAHPDDEALFTAGSSTLYAGAGRKIVLVTCTNGRLGLDDQVLAGCDPNHHTTQTAITRAGELARSISLIGVTRHVTLGYGDSGLPGWPHNADPTSFVNVEVEAAARTVASIFDEEGVTVAVTYDENGYYGHPDHIQAHLVTRRACELSTMVQRLFYPVTPASVLQEFRVAAAAQRAYLPLWIEDAGEGVADAAVDVTIDATAVAGVKRSSIRAHASQVDNADVMEMADNLFNLLFAREYFALGWSRHPGEIDATDLFGGLE